MVPIVYLPVLIFYIDLFNLKCHFRLLDIIGNQRRKQNTIPTKTTNRTSRSSCKHFMIIDVKSVLSRNKKLSVTANVQQKQEQESTVSFQCDPDSFEINFLLNSNKLPILDRRYFCNIILDKFKS